MSVIAEHDGSFVGTVSRTSGKSDLALAFRFALRELRGGLCGFYVFLACIALGVAAIAGVNSVALSITDGIAQEGKAILGGDLSFNTLHRRLTTEEQAFVESIGTTQEVAKMRAMARLPDGSDQSLVELKAVDLAYPLEGVFVSEPSLSSADISREGGIVADPLLLSRLNLKIGDKIKLGSKEFPILATITDEPDKVSDGVGFGPKVLIGADQLLQSGLVQPGSLVTWKMRVALNDPSPENLERVVEEANEKFPEAGWRIRSKMNAAPSLARNIIRFSQFLTLVGLTALIVGGVGVANAIRAFLDTKRHVIASFKSLGAPAAFVFSVYLIQILILAAIGIAIGLALGSLMPFAAKYALADVIPVGAGSPFHPSALISAIAYGFLTALAFAIWPLGQARDIPATALFRELARENSDWPRLSFVLTTALAISLLCILAIWQSSEQRIAEIFIGGIAFSFLLLRGVSILIQFLARRVGQIRSTPLRMAIGNIHRPGALTPSVVLSLGLGLALLVALALIDGNLRNQISANIPETAPDFFFVDIQDAKIDEFRSFIAATQPGGDFQTTPMLRGRIKAINDVQAEKIKPAEGGAWVLRGDRGITYAPDKPENATLEKGEWWPNDYSGPPLVSFSAEEAGEIGVKIGDKITVNVLGRDITAEVSNLRNVEWQSMSINFVMVFSPNTFAGAPHAHLATLRLPKETFGGGQNLRDQETKAETKRDADVLKSITQNFPTVTTVRVRDALTAVNDLIEQLATAIRAAAVLALVASVLVLAGALAAGNRARVHDAVVLKTLGATRKTLIGAYVLEYSILGLATALFALIAGGAASWFVISQVMGFKAVFMPEIALATVALALVFTVGFGLIGTWRVLGQKAAPVLREL